MPAIAQNNSAQGSGSAEEIIKEQLCKILTLIQGTFGALVTIVAGLAAVVTAAMGGYKLAMSCVVSAPTHPAGMRLSVEKGNMEREPAFRKECVR